MTKRIMLDLETLSSKKDALVVSIGAVEFGPEGVGHREFYEVLERSDQVGYGRHVDPDTVAWWMQQSDEARAVFKGKTIAADLGLSRFSAYCATVNDRLDETLEIWGYGATFDNVVLRGLYEAYGMKAPWTYRGDMCYRTLVNLAKARGLTPPARTGTHHNALDDAKYQATCAVIVLKDLGIK